MAPFFSRFSSPFSHVGWWVRTTTHVAPSTCTSSRVSGGRGGTECIHEQQTSSRKVTLSRGGQLGVPVGTVRAYHNKVISGSADGDSHTVYTWLRTCLHVLWQPQPSQRLCACVRINLVRSAILVAIRRYSLNHWPCRHSYSFH
jgi:hypothetical protein